MSVPHDLDDQTVSNTEVLMALWIEHWIEDLDLNPLGLCKVFVQLSQNLYQDTQFLLRLPHTPMSRELDQP